MRVELEVTLRDLYIGNRFKVCALRVWWLPVQGRFQMQRTRTGTPFASPAPGQQLHPLPLPCSSCPRSLPLLPPELPCICRPLLQVTRIKNVIKSAPGKRQCNCKQKMVTQQIGPGMYQQFTKTVSVGGAPVCVFEG